jgi:hypothetical protein
MYSPCTGVCGRRLCSNGASSRIVLGCAQVDEFESASHVHCGHNPRLNVVIICGCSSGVWLSMTAAMTCHSAGQVPDDQLVVATLWLLHGAVCYTAVFTGSTGSLLHHQWQPLPAGCTPAAVARLVTRMWAWQCLHAIIPACHVTFFTCHGWPTCCCNSVRLLKVVVFTGLCN